MKTMIISISLVAFALLSVHADSAEQSAPVSFTFDDVELIDMVRILSTITGVGFTFDPSDLKFSERISISVREKPWKPVLIEALAQHGLVLVEHAPDSDSYAIIPAESTSIATRFSAATKAVAAMDAILVQLENGDIEKAKELVSKYRLYNDAIRKAMSKQGDSANKVSEDIGASAPNPQH